MRVRFLVTPVGLMMGNVESARRLAAALARRGVEVTTEDDQGRVDILHVHTPVPPRNFRIVRRMKRAGVPVVMHAHTTTEDSIGTWSGSKLFSGITGTYLTRFYNLGDLVLAPSAWTKSRLEARGVVAPIQVVSNGVEIERFSEDEGRRARFRQRYGIDNDELVVYSIGVMCLKKGIETFPEVARALPRIQFLWTGRRSNLYHPVRVSRAVKSCGPNVRFLSDVTDIVDAHCGGDIFFTPSFAENQGMAVMEALSVGRPVVARALPSYDGLLVDGRTAILGHRTKDFISSIEHLSSDHSLLSSLVESGKEAIKSHNISNVAERLESIYKSVLEDAASGS